MLRSHMLRYISIVFNPNSQHWAYAESLKETQSQDRHKFILGNPQGEEDPTKLLLYRCIKRYKDKPQTRCSFSLSVCLSLSPMRYTQVCVRIKWGTHILYVYSFFHLIVFPNRSTPTKLMGWLHLGRHKTI